MVNLDEVEEIIKNNCYYIMLSKMKNFKLGTQIHTIVNDYKYNNIYIFCLYEKASMKLIKRLSVYDYYEENISSSLNNVFRKLYKEAEDYPF